MGTFGWDYPPGVTGCEPQIAGYPEDDCGTCMGSGEIVVQLKHREIEVECPMCEGACVLSVDEGPHLTHEQAEEIAIMKLTGEDLL